MHFLSLIGWLSAFFVAIRYVLRFAGRAFRAKLILTETALSELEVLRRPSKPTVRIPGTAIVAGGSIAGMLTARVCHDFFERVLIVEPEGWLFEDVKTTTPWEIFHKRSRLIQYLTFQGFQPISYLILEALFPSSFSAEVKAGGIRTGPADNHIYMWGRREPVPSEEYGGNLPKTLFCGRPGLESLVRRLLLGRGDYPNIQTVAGTVTGIVADGANIGRAVLHTPSGTEEIECALLVDCTGPATAGLKWLSAANFGGALDKLRTGYDPKMNYSTFTLPVTDEYGQRLPIPEGWDNAQLFYIIFPDTALDNKMIFAQRIENGRVQICCGQYAGSDLPRTIAQVKDFARSMVAASLIPGWFFEVLDMLNEIDDQAVKSRVRCSASIFTRYHDAKNLPANFIAIGDSIMKLNPIFGHGCTQAVLGVVALDSTLRKACCTEVGSKAPPCLPANFSRDFFAAQRTKIEPIWNTTKIVDYGLPTTVPIPGESLSSGVLIRWYQRCFQLLVFTDKDAYSAIWHVRSFLAPQIDMIQPSLVFKVLWIGVTHPNIAYTNKSIY